MTDIKFRASPDTSSFMTLVMPREPIVDMTMGQVIRFFGLHFSLDRSLSARTIQRVFRGHRARAISTYVHDVEIAEPETDFNEYEEAACFLKQHYRVSARHVKHAARRKTDNNWRKYRKNKENILKGKKHFPSGLSRKNCIERKRARNAKFYR